MFSQHHYDVNWCTIGDISIMYHANMTSNISVQYDERSVFGSHGQYAVWLGTTPRSFSVWSNMVGANKDEVTFNVQQVLNAYHWTQESPPGCKDMIAPISLDDGLTGHTVKVRIESYDSTIEEATMMVGAGSGMGFTPIQITLSLTLKECKPI